MSCAGVDNAGPSGEGAKMRAQGGRATLLSLRGGDDSEVTRQRLTLMTTPEKSAPALPDLSGKKLSGDELFNQRSIFDPVYDR
eukprot:7584452-Pyramimonas_sp.AAC.1